MAKTKKADFDISTGEDKSTKPQRRGAFFIAGVITIVIVCTALFVACDSGISGSSENNPSFDWEKNVRGTEWKRESESAVFQENEILKAVSSCDTLKIGGDNRLRFSGGVYGTAGDPESVLDFDDVTGGGENSDGEVEISGMDFRFHFSKAGNVWYLRLTVEGGGKSLLYKH